MPISALVQVCAGLIALVVVFMLLASVLVPGFFAR